MRHSSWVAHCCASLQLRAGDNAKFLRHGERTGERVEAVSVPNVVASLPTSQVSSTETAFPAGSAMTAGSFEMSDLIRRRSRQPPRRACIHGNKT